MAAAVTPSVPVEGRGELRVVVRRHAVDVAMSVPLTGVTVLFGPSGAGKTTLLRAVAGLDRAPGSRVVHDGVVWDDGARRFVPPRLREVGYLVQEHALFPHLDVHRNVAYGLQRRPRRERDARVREVLAAVGAGALLGRRVPGLSGGEAQRVALARSLAPRPRLLLLDEPLSALDAPTRARLRTDLRRILLAERVPTLVVTHDRTEALALADRVVLLIGGRLRQHGTPAEVFDRPGDPDVARAVGVETAVHGLVRSVTGGLVQVAVGQARLTALAGALAEADADPPVPGEAVVVCVRAEDVVLVTGSDTSPGSARNRLPAVVTALGPAGPVVRVDLDAGFPLTAYITRPALEELGLRPGSTVRALVKSPAVHLVRRGTEPPG